MRISRGAQHNRIISIFERIGLFFMGLTEMDEYSFIANKIIIIMA